jgi:uncharacterized protein (DUF58 family)
MSLESRVAALGFATVRAARSLSVFLRGSAEKIVRRNRHDANSEIAHDQPVVFQTKTPGPETETFFDADFLKKLERLHLIAKRLDWAGAKGEHAASRKGYSLEFADYRRYQRGDDLRYVDWNVYRRLDRLLLKVFTAEEEMNIYLLLDTSRSMAFGGGKAQAAPAKIDYAKKVAAAVGYIGLKNLDRVGGAAFSSIVHAPLKLGRGRTQILRLFGFLNRLSCAGPTDLRAAMHKFTTLFPQPGLAVIVSDLFDPAGWRAATEELARKKYQVLIIHLIDEEELQPAIFGDVALVDAEGSRERRVFVDAEMARRFQEELASYFHDIEMVCGNLGIDYLRTTTRVPFDDFVLKSLRQVSSVT